MSRSVGAVTASTKANSTGSWHQAAWLSPLGWLHSNCLPYKACPTTLSRQYSLLAELLPFNWWDNIGPAREKSNFHSGLFESKVKLRCTLTRVSSPASFNRRVGSYPALVPHPVLLSLQEVQTSGPPPPPVSDRIFSCSFSSTFTYKRHNQLNFFSASGTFSLSLFLLVLLPNGHRPPLSLSLSLGSLVRAKPLSSGPNTNSLSPLFTPSICLLFDSSSKCPPLLPSRLQELLLHVTPVGKEKKQGEAVE